MINNVIILCEIARQNDGIHDETLQFVGLDNRFYMLPSVEIVRIIEHLGDGVWERLRDEIRRSESPYKHTTKLFSKLYNHIL